MALPKLTIKLFPPRPGKPYAAGGNLTIALSDVHALAEWLLGQAGEYDDYLQQNVVRMLAFEYNNTSRSGHAYRTIQLRDPADLSSSRPPQPAPWSPPATAADGAYGEEEIPF
jgi:hypothetical protein